MNSNIPENYLYSKRACGISTGGEPVVSGFSAWRYETSDGKHLKYRLHQPELCDKLLYPLVIHFHGAGSRGNDNIAQLRFAETVINPGLNRNDCFVFAPQCPAERRWVDVDWNAMSHCLPETMTAEMNMAVAVIDAIIADYPVDIERIYLFGQSMGAFAIWDLLCRRPGMFAAAVPVCGGGDENCAELINNVPIWTFHGALDQTVKVERSQNMIAALLSSGGTPRYTELPEVAHNAWDYCYTPELFDWMFRQKNVVK